MVKLVTILFYIVVLGLGWALTYPLGWWALAISLPISFISGTCFTSWRIRYEERKGQK